MNTHARYQPVRDFPGYICCLSEEDAKKQNKTVGGEIIKVPVFNSRQSAIQWIRKQKKS